MSVTLTSHPPDLAFSADKIIAGFTCEGVYDQVGVKAINRITFPNEIPVGTTITIAYGSENIVMTAVIVPDDSVYNTPEESQT